MQRRRSYTTATGTPKPPAGQPEVLRLLDKSIGNKWFLHLLLPAVVGLNGWAHMYAVLPTDTYWLPAAYWTYSVGACPLIDAFVTWSGSVCAAAFQDEASEGMAGELCHARDERVPVRSSYGTDLAVSLPPSRLVLSFVAYRS